MGFRYERTIRFHEVDGAGILYFNRILQYCHEAYEEFLASARLQIADILSEGRWGTPLVHAEADFEQPFRLGERIAVTLSVGRIGKTSVTYDYELTGPGGERRATAQLIHACVDRREFEKIPIPDALRTALESLNGGSGT